MYHQLEDETNLFQWFHILYKNFAILKFHAFIVWVLGNS